MLKRLSILLVAVIALVAMALSLTAGTFAHAASFSYSEPGASSADSGTCGNFWAQDNYDRLYTASDAVIDPTVSSPATVTESFQNGSFTTTAVPFGISPGSCDLGQASPGLNNPVYAHIPGSFSGTETITVAGGHFDPTGCVKFPTLCQTLTGDTNGKATGKLIQALYGSGKACEYVDRLSTENSSGCQYHVTAFDLTYLACTTGQGNWNNAGDNVHVLFNSGDITGMASSAVNADNPACPQPTPTPIPPTPTPVPPTPTPTPVTPQLPKTGSDPLA